MLQNINDAGSNPIVYSLNYASNSTLYLFVQIVNPSQPKINIAAKNYWSYNSFNIYYSKFVGLNLAGSIKYYENAVTFKGFSSTPRDGLIQLIDKL